MHMHYLSNGRKMVSGFHDSFQKESYFKLNLLYKFAFVLNCEACQPCTLCTLKNSDGIKSSYIEGKQSMGNRSQQQS